MDIINCPTCGHPNIKNQRSTCLNCDHSLFDDYDDYDDDDSFQPCDDCDLPDACADFGCAIKNGVRKQP